MMQYSSILFAKIHEPYFITGISFPIDTKHLSSCTHVGALLGFSYLGLYFWFAYSTNESKINVKTQVLNRTINKITFNQKNWKLNMHIIFLTIGLKIGPVFNLMDTMS